MVLVAFFILPFSWMVSMGFDQTDEWFLNPPRLIPQHPTLDNYIGALDPFFLRYALNSILVSTFTTVTTIVFAVFCAYAFSRLRFPLRRQLFTLIIMTQLLPLVVLIIPIYRFFAEQGLINTYPALVISYLTFTVPVAVWLLRGFFASIPIELEEAAKLDGCTQMGAFMRVVLPLSMPGISRHGYIRVLQHLAGAAIRAVADHHASQRTCRSAHPGLHRGTPDQLGIADGVVGLDLRPRCSSCSCSCSASSSRGWWRAASRAESPRLSTSGSGLHRIGDDARAGVAVGRTAAARRARQSCRTRRLEVGQR